MKPDERRKKHRTGGVSDFAKKLLNKTVQQNGLAGALLSDPEGVPVSMVFDPTLLSEDNRSQLSALLAKNIRSYFEKQLDQKKSQVFDFRIAGMDEELCAVCKGLVAMDEFLILTLVGGKNRDYDSLAAELTRAISRIVEQEMS